jgi:hypothetical protein
VERARNAVSLAGHRGRILVLAPTLASLSVADAARADAPVETARTLLRGYHEDPSRIDRARDLLEARLARDGADPATLVRLARAIGSRPLDDRGCPARPHPARVPSRQPVKAGARHPLSAFGAIGRTSRRPPQLTRPTGPGRDEHSAAVPAPGARR